MSIEIKNKFVAKRVKHNMKKFGTYVNMDRALGELADGLKPSQRRVLYTMYKDLGIRPGSNKVKVARIDGATTGVYHPHGSAAGPLVNMAVPHIMRYPLIDPQGFFGDWTRKAAASRYIECRLKPIAMELFKYVEVAYMESNYDGTAEEPLFLPSRLPFLLLNGSEGIGVGMSSSIPSHNLTEVMQACIQILKDPDTSLKSIMKFIKGPDYNHGSLISSKEEVCEMYKQGKGTLRYQCLFKLEQDKKLGEERLVITSYGSGFSVSSYIKRCSKLVDEGLLKYVADETDIKSGIRLVVAFTNAAILNDHVLPLLESTHSYQFYMTVHQGDTPVLIPTNLLGILKSWIEYREVLEIKFQEHEKIKLESRLEKEETRLKAIENPKIWLGIMNSSKSEEDALTKLMHGFKISREMADFMLGFTMRSLLKANKIKQASLIKDIKHKISEIKCILKDVKKELIRQFNDDIEKYGDKRCSGIGRQEANIKSSVSSVYILATKKGKIEKVNTLPLKGRKLKWDFIIKTSGKYTVVDETGMAYVFDLAATIKKKIKNIVGLVSHDFPMYVVLDKDGRASFLETDQNKKRFYQTFKTQTKLISVVPLKNKDELVISGEDIKILDSKAIKKNKKRPNTKGKLFNIGEKPRAYSIPHGGSLCDEELNDLVDAEEIKDAYHLHSLGKKGNLVVFSDGSKGVMNFSDLDGEKNIKKVFRFS